MKKMRHSLVLAATMFLSSMPAFAVTEVNQSFGGSASHFDGNIQTSDLLTGLTGTSTVAPNAGTIAGINDGSAASLSNDTEFDSTAFAPNGALNKNPVLTFDLNTSVSGSPTGYDLTSITSIYGWNNYSSRADQSYTVSYSTVTDPSVFQTLFTVNYSPYQPAAAVGQSIATSTEVTLTDLTAATGVYAIQFTFTPTNGGTSGDMQDGQLIREIDVDGTPAIVPEPSMWMLMGLGGLFLVWHLRPNRRLI